MGPQNNSSRPPPIFILLAIKAKNPPRSNVSLGIICHAKAEFHFPENLLAEENTKTQQ